MHRLIREDERIEVLAAFAEQHFSHIRSIEFTEGDWSLVMHCSLCHDWQTFQIDNEARREALKCRGSEAAIKAVS